MENYMVQLSPQAEVIARKRYYMKNDKEEVVENAEMMFKRVAKGVAKVEPFYGKHEIDAKLMANDFYDIMAENKFLPNSPTLMNGGTEQGTLSACFVLPIQDSMEGIMKAAHDTAMVQKFGGGTGFALSNLRPKGDRIKTTHGVSCGPIEVLKTLSRVSSMITQGGKRDGANMAVMDVHHPDIMEFIDCKKIEGDIHNFNISVGVTDDFMKAVKSGTNYPLINPRTNAIVKELSARDVFSKIVSGAWRNGEPGMVFLDTINKDNKVEKEHGRMIATNPCGEQPLLGNESCNLGSINLAEFFKSTSLSTSTEPSVQWQDNVDWDGLEQTIKIAIRFLDNVIDANEYATKDIETMTKATRKIGLGVMGFADLLIQLRIPYNSSEARSVGSEIMKFIQTRSDIASQILAEERGTFPSWADSDFAKDEIKFRNACRLTVAPTGTISMLANTSSGIEPTFALAWKKMNVLEGETFYYTNKYFEEDAKKYEFYSDDLMEHISEGGSLQEREDVPDWVKNVYVTSPEISGSDHVRMQSAFQKFCDAGISKTINLPSSATQVDVGAAYMLAYESGCKGITVYRAGSRDKEVLVAETKSDYQIPKYDPDMLYSTWDGSSNGDYMVWTANLSKSYDAKRNESIDRLTTPVLDNTMVTVQDVCCDSPFLVEEGGCITCHSCGWSKCHIA
jgi:ribonucleoside-diphosphate reductase alpha chain